MKQNNKTDSRTDTAEGELREQKLKIKNKLFNLFKAIIFIAILFIIFKIYLSEYFTPAVIMSGSYAKEMIMIFPAVLLLMGLADVWIPSSMIKKYLGQKSGISGKLLAIFLGSLPAGPMYVAFPLASELLKKKPSLSNIIIFLGIWASLKIPQIGVEIQFLGLKFAFLRFIFTLISVILMGLIIEKLVDRETL
ncbi:putative permease [Halanaerobium saccharolyticum]|uniref:Putative permease n=1 Tax=Halanaerobium saccharolyticum TaxID=43595 RepID=A0A4V3G593_9FIRM|nr:permease [Halanaerobium saccharolyticum]RAK08487.1 putative permease [Halanaerobium saccharolyticum]TDW03478.1 putative permease [Halanaerobium saccharolyticum]TDX59979.1 putative permease [Halanaerobium saccharolyticum]